MLGLNGLDSDKRTNLHMEFTDNASFYFGTSITLRENRKEGTYLLLFESIIRKVLTRKRHNELTQEEIKCAKKYWKLFSMVLDKYPA